MKTKRLLSLVTAVLVACLLAPAPSAWATSGLGVAPTNLHFTDVLPGSGVQKQITLHNYAETTQQVSIEKSGDTADWLSFPAGQTLSIQAGASMTLTAVLEVPASAGLGTYFGSIRIRAEPSGTISSGAGAQIAPGVVLPVSVTVTDTVRVALSLVDVSITNPEVGQPLELTLALENSGNVAVSPVARVEILDATQTTVLRTAEAELPEVVAGARVELPVSISTEDLKTETNYWARTSVTLADGTTTGQLVRAFDVVEPGGGACIAYLSALWAPSQANAGEPVNVVATVENAGDVVTYAQLRGTVTGRDGVEVASLTSPIVAIQPGTRGQVVASFVPTEEANYTITGRVYHGPSDQQGPEGLTAMTETKTVYLSTYPFNGTTGSPVTQWLLIGGLAVLVVALAVFGPLLWRRYRSRTPAR